MVLNIIFKTFEYSNLLNMEEQEPKPERERGWCRDCGLPQIADESSAPGELICPACGSEMVAVGRLNKRELSMFRFQEWLSDVYTSGKSGPSPGGAASARNPMPGCLPIGEPRKMGYPAP